MKALLLFSMFIFILFTESGCVHKSVGNVEKPPMQVVSQTNVGGIESTVVSKKPVKFIWNAEFEKELKQAVPEVLLNLKPIVLKDYCPNWDNLNLDARRQAFVDIAYGVARFESAYNPLTLFWEKGQGKDSVTGEIVLSEGLMQLSYADSKWAKCGFDYKKDKEMHLKDLAMRGTRQSWVSEHASKTILEPKRNVVCAFNIMAFRAKRNVDRDFKLNMGAYWSTIRDKTPQILAQMKKKGSVCF